MSRVIGWIVVAVLGLDACGGVALKDSKVPNGDAFPQTPSDIQVFSTDDTFKFTPEYWLGSVGVVRKTQDQCGDLSKFEWTDVTMRNDSGAGSGTGIPPANPDDFAQTLGYSLSPKRTEPDLRLQSVITQQVAAKTAALSFFSSDLSSEVVAQVAITDIAVQRAKPSREFDAALASLKTTHKADLLDPDDICYVFVVMGYSEKTLLRKYHYKTTAKAGGGFSGVSVDGTYFASNEDYKFDYLFGLSVRILKRPHEVATTPTRGCP